MPQWIIKRAERTSKNKRYSMCITVCLLLFPPHRSFDKVCNDSNIVIIHSLVHLALIEFNAVHLGSSYCLPVCNVTLSHNWSDGRCVCKDFILFILSYCTVGPETTSCQREMNEYWAKTWPISKCYKLFVVRWNIDCWNCHCSLTSVSRKKAIMGSISQ